MFAFSQHLGISGCLIKNEVRACVWFKCLCRIPAEIVKLNVNTNQRPT